MSERTARLICRETDIGAAANVGGPALVQYKTFVTELPPEVAAWLRDVTKWSTREIVAVEFDSAKGTT